MELSDELLEQIGAYLSGQMSGREKDQFETRLQQDIGLRQEVALQQELKQGLSFLAQKDRFKQMQAELDKRGLLSETEIQPDQPVNLRPPATETMVVPLPQTRSAFRYGWASWVMAASLVLLLGIGWVLYRNQLEKRQSLAQNDRLFDDFFSVDLKPAPGIPPDPDRLAAPSDNGQSALDSIRLHVAVEALQQAEERQTIIKELAILSTGRPGHWSASAQWYLALAYLRNNQRAEAEPLLQTIAQLNGHPYQPQAQRLLNQLTISPPSQP